jgi:hypothetical protein
MNDQTSSTTITPERCKFLLSLTDVEKVRILLGRSVPAAAPVTGIERQFIRAHLTPSENELLYYCV